MTNLVARLLVVLQQGGQQRGDELEGAAGDGVGRARVRVDVVAGEEAHPLRPQLVLVHRLLAQDDRQVLLEWICISVINSWLLELKGASTKRPKKDLPCK